MAELEKQLASLIDSGQIEARIDSHNKVKGECGRRGSRREGKGGEREVRGGREEGTDGRGRTAGRERRRAEWRGRTGEIGRREGGIGRRAGRRVGMTSGGSS